MKQIVAEIIKETLRYQSQFDTVRWQAKTPSGTIISPKWEFTNCYASALQYELGTLELRCIPGRGPRPEAQMPEMWYLYLFKLLKEVGLCPPEVEAIYQNGANCLIIPPNPWDRHTIYIALCYYRQSDIHPGELMQALMLYEKLRPQGTTLLQCLHWCAMHTSLGSGHYFMAPAPYGGADKNDLANGQALAWFAKQTLAERLQICPPKKSGGYDNHYTYTLLAQKAKLFPSLKVEDLSEILNPKYAHLYQNPELVDENSTAGTALSG